MSDALVSVVHDEHASYDREPSDQSSPDAMVRRAVADACGGDPDAAAWNPLADFVAPAGRVHVLPNFVSHRRDYERTEAAYFAKVTHPAVLRPVIDLARRAVGGGGRIVVGNAPIQGCDFERLKRDAHLDQLIADGPNETQPRAELADLRGIRTEWNAAGALLSLEETGEQLVEVDLGEESLLEPLYGGGRHPRFRVGDYDPRLTDSYHGRGRHIYVVNRRVLDSDLVISVPKLKTHEKVGITCALKGTVGMIARKECLAHHRMGGSASGGDEFPGNSMSHRAMSELLEVGAAQSISKRGNAVRVLSKTVFRALKVLNPGTVGGGWSGNDTAWRMALDIARILRFARVDGTLASTPQRRHIAIVDGIVSGEGNGPLRPIAKHSGVVLFGSDVCAVDAACAMTMGLEPARLPIVREAFTTRAYPLTDLSLAGLRFTLNGHDASPSQLQAVVGSPHQMPAGWR